MASSTQKKTTTKKSGSRSGSRTAKGKQPQKRPIRREVGGVILLVLALCVLVSYCGVQAILIDLLAKLLKGLFGYGYWLAGPAMLLAGGILLLHRGRPVTLRATCALLLPLLAGALFHTIFAGGDYALNGWGVLKNLWTAGLALKAGGAVSGLLAEAAVLAVSKVVSLFLFGLLLAVLLLAALHVTPSAVLEMVRNRPEYEEEPEPTPAVHIAPAEPPRRRGERQSRPAIDIPLDGEEPSAQPEEESGRFTGFFRHKSDKMKTPDQVLSDKEAEQAALEPAPSPARAKAAPTPAPVAEEVSVPEPAPAAPAAPPAPAAGKRAVAQEVAAATAAVTAEIEQKLTEDADTYQFPPITLLQESREENYAETGAELRNNSRRLAETLTSFGVDATAGDVATPSYDLEHEIDATYPTEHITRELVEEVLTRFIGAIDQVPPAFSACMVDGKRAYELARKGEEVELKAKQLVIDEIELLECRLDDPEPMIQIRVVCSKGTYIRALARDIGEALHSGAHLTGLIRTRVGDVRLEDCLNPEHFKEWIDGQEIENEEENN